MTLLSALRSIAALACVVWWAFSDSPDRIALLFAAVFFTVNAAADRVISAVKEKP